MTEYQALVLGLSVATRMGIKDRDVYGDLKLVISLLLEEFEMKKDNCIPCHKHGSRLLNTLETVKLEHVPMSANKMADALANLAAIMALG